MISVASRPSSWYVQRSFVGKRIVGAVAERAEVNARERVVGEVGADVLAVDDTLDHGPDLGLARREVTGAPRCVSRVALPLVREVAVRVDARPGRRRGDRDAVVALQCDPRRGAGSRGQVPSSSGSRATSSRGSGPYGLPRAVRVGDPHLELAAVVIDVAGHEAVELFAVRP